MSQFEFWHYTGSDALTLGFLVSYARLRSLSLRRTTGSHKARR